MNDLGKGLYAKYEIFKISDGLPLDGPAFVLRPDRDPAAVAALRAYAEATENKALSKDIYRWISQYCNYFRIGECALSSDEAQVVSCKPENCLMIPKRENKPLTPAELREMNADMKNRPWVWIEVLESFSVELKTSAYYQAQSDYTHDRAFCCGYPGLGFHFEYADYGKTWVAYAHRPKEDAR